MEDIDILVDQLLERKKPIRVRHRFKKFGLGVGGLLVAFLIGFNLVLPIFNHKEDIEIIEVENKILNPEFLGDEQNNSEAWLKRPNSFGGNMVMNWSYFWNLFNKHSAWQLEAWNPQTETWIDEYNGENLNNWLTITKNRSADNSSEKVALTVVNNGPINTYFRFKFGIDLRVKNYINKTSNFEYTLTYPANLTTDYQVFFNWSDLKQDMQDGKITVNHGIKNYQGKDIFYFVIRGLQQLPVGQSYTLDPTFGDDYESGAVTPIDDYIAGITEDGGLSPASDGQATKISAKLYNFDSGDSGRCALYTYDGNYDFYAETEEISGGSDGWFDFDFDPYVNIYSDTTYSIAVFTDGSNDRIYNQFLACDYNLELEGWNDNNYPTWEDPITWDTTASPRHVGLYCTYNEGIPWSNTAPAIQVDSPANNSINIGTSPTVSAWVNDTDGNSTTVNFYTSTDGSSWTWQQTNTSHTANTTASYVYTGATEGNTLYYWKVTAEDDYDNTSAWFNFTTGSVTSWQQVSDWNLTLSNITSYNQIDEWNITLSNITSYNQIDDWNLTLSNKTLSYKQISDWNLTLSNITSYNQIAEWNITLSNITSYNQIDDWNLTLSNSTEKAWVQIDDWNITLSNTTNHQQINDWNITLSNDTVNWQQIDEWNLTLSNKTLSYKQISDWNLTLSNITSYNQIAEWNLTLSNKTKEWLQIDDWNITLSNITSYNQIDEWNITLSNSSTPDLYNITITDPYPSNNSNNNPLQPTIYVTINHTEGEQMNISWYYGTSQGNENILVGTDNTLNNGTVTELYYPINNRSTDYYWRVMVNAGGEYINESFVFKTEYMDSGIVYPISNYAYSLIGLIGILGLITLFKRKKNKNNDEYE